MIFGVKLSKRACIKYNSIFAYKHELDKIFENSLSPPKKKQVEMINMVLNQQMHIVEAWTKIFL